MPDVAELDRDARRKLASALWRSPRPGLVDVWCGGHRHRLGRVYNISGRRVLCVPEVDYAYGETVLHADLLDIDNPDDYSEAQWLRCRCSAWSLPRERLLSQISLGAPWIMPDKMRVFRKDDTSTG